MDSSYAYDPVAAGTVNQQAYRMEAGQVWRQYIIAGIANIVIVSTGYSMGWTAPINIKLQDNTTGSEILGRPATEGELAWIGSLLNVGAILGPFIGGFLGGKIGRKWGILSSVIPLLIGWILTLVASNVAFLYASRIFWGIAVGMLFTICPMYCAEISTNESRGALGSFLQLFITGGFLLVYGIGPFISYWVVTYVGIASVAVAAVTFVFMPETPTYYLMKQDRESAARCLQKIRGRSRAGVEQELAVMASDVSASLEKTATLMDVFRGTNFKAFYISCALLFFQQFSGINAVLFYMTDIFKASGTNLDPSIATIIIGAVQMGASAVTPLVVDRLGRRLLLLVSSFGTAIGAALLGTFFLLQSQNSEALESISFLPVLSLVLFIVTYCWGLGPLPWAVIGELLPIEVKAAASPIATAFCWTLSFLVTLFFPSIEKHIGFFLFGGCCCLSFIFLFFMMPETKGKSFAEIQEILAGKRKSEKA